MNNNNILPRRPAWKYDLKHESLAAAASGLASYADLDKRCITFTVHLHDPALHEPLCRVLFTQSEAYFTKLLGKSPKVSHCGLLSSLDVNGSKFSGADRDPRNAHCHSCIFMPHGITPHDLDRLLRVLQDTARMFHGVKAGREAIRFTSFDRDSHAATLADWIGYAQKEATRADANGTFCLILPFDDRVKLGVQVEAQMERRRAEILRALSGSDQFKVYRSSKAPSEKLADLRV